MKLGLRNTVLWVKAVMVFMFIAMVLLSKANTSVVFEEKLEQVKTNETFRHGQYVYITLKNGTQTIAKIAGRKNLKKYYVNEVSGNRRGLVHRKHIRPLTKDELEMLKYERAETLASAQKYKN